MLFFLAVFLSLNWVLLSSSLCRCSMFQLCLSVDPRSLCVVFYYVFHGTHGMTTVRQMLGKFLIVTVGYKRQCL